MIGQKFRVKVDGDWLEVDDIRPGDVVAWEDHFDLSAQALDQPGALRLKWIGFLCWRALGREGRLGANGDRPAFEEFLEQLEDFEIGDAPAAGAEDTEEDADRPAPFDEEASTTGSPSSSSSSASPGTASKASAPTP